MESRISQPARTPTMAQHHAAQATRMARRLGALEFAKCKPAAIPVSLRTTKLPKNSRLVRLFPCGQGDTLGKSSPGSQTSVRDPEKEKKMMAARRLQVPSGIIMVHITHQPCVTSALHSVPSHASRLALSPITALVLLTSIRGLCSSSAYHLEACDMLLPTACSLYVGSAFVAIIAVSVEVAERRDAIW